MKKLLLGSITLCLFSFSMILFQMSCKKDVVAQSNNQSTINKLVYYKIISNVVEIWTSKYDGTAQTKINLSIPTGLELDEDVTPRLSPDGLKVFFVLYSEQNNVSDRDLYSANIDGSNVVKIVDNGGNGNDILLGGAY